MNEKIEPGKNAPLPLSPVKPVGTWIVGGFLLVVSLAVWCLVAALFSIRT